MPALKLKKQLSKINDVIPRGSRVYYFDYPVHNNVGDMLIWKGTERFFKESKFRVVKRFSYHMVNYLIKKKKLQIPKDVIIVCHGGGNFGDLYKVHQELRALLVRTFPNHRIVILPQSIYYEDKNKMKTDFDIFNKHKDLHLFVRDMSSFATAKNFIEKVYLLQDMAHALYPIDVNQGTEENTLYFLRKDKERLDTTPNMEEISKGFDWHLLFSKRDTTILKLFSRAHASYKIHKILSSNLLAKLYQMYTDYIINKAIKLFSVYETIVTSRLHGHILAILMNKKSIIIDNSYGKNSNYYKCWTNSIKNTELYKIKK